MLANVDLLPAYISVSSFGDFWSQFRLLGKGRMRRALFSALYMITINMLEIMIKLTDGIYPVERNFEGAFFQK